METYELQEKAINATTLVLVISGEINSFNTQRLRDEVERSVGLGYKTFLFDFSGVTEIDSIGVGAFFAVAKLLSGIDGRARIFGPSTQMKKVLELAQLDRYVPIFKNFEEALQGTAPATRQHKN